MVINFGPGGNCQCTGGTGCSLTSITQTYTGNDTYTISIPQDFDGFSGGTITVNVPQPQLEEKNFNISDNGTTLITPTSGKYISGGTITVSVPLTEQNISITANGDTLITVPANYAGITGGTISVNVPQTVTGKSLNSFMRGEVTELVPDDFIGVTSIPQYMFAYNSSFTGLTFPAHAITVGNDCFKYSNVGPHLDVPAYNTYSTNTFQMCRQITSVTITSESTGNTMGAQSMFDNCSNLVTIEGFEKFTKMPVSQFSYCRSLVGDYTVSRIASARIGYNCFADCNKINSLTFAGPVGEIGTTWSSCFTNCTSMTYYDFTHCVSVPELKNSGDFNNIPANCEIRVPQYLYDAWTAATNWSASSIVNHIVSYPNPSGYGEWAITYTSTAANKPNIYAGNVSGLVSHEYDSSTGEGVITFYGDGLLDGMFINNNDEYPGGVNFSGLTAETITYPANFKGFYHLPTQNKLYLSYLATTITFLGPVPENMSKVEPMYITTSGQKTLYVPSEYYDDYVSAISNMESGSKWKSYTITSIT